MESEEKAENITIDETELDKVLSEDELKVMFPDENLRNVVVRNVTYTAFANPQGIPRS